MERTATAPVEVRNSVVVTGLPLGGSVSGGSISISEVMIDSLNCFVLMFGGFRFSGDWV